ncbi:MAG TPA: imidazolonepropionase, partial [Amnibacterium sp.]|nr:imidazolonepropionase [Amnibacterium sp.]
MTTTLIDGIGLLVRNVDGDGLPDELPTAAVVVEDGRIAWIGRTAHAPAADARFDAGGRCVIPGFVDSHTHLLFAGDRSAEFEARMAGRAYSAGGIRTTVAATRAASDDALLARATGLVAEARRQGTTTIEIKSGYGLTVEDEARALRLAAGLTAETTLLGAHVVPPEYADDPDAYVDLVTGPMLAACAPHARWIDVFCDRGAFSVEQAERILVAGRDAGLGLRLHAAQLAPSPAVRLAVTLGAASVDHCTHLEEADVDALAH